MEKKRTQEDEQNSKIVKREQVQNRSPEKSGKEIETKLGELNASSYKYGLNH